MVNFKFKKGDSVKIEKITDEKFGGFHPNGIDVGYYEFGILDDDIKVGERCLVRDHFRYLNTSTVTEILSEDTFRTRNSIYKLSYKIDTSLLTDNAEELLEEINNMSIT